MARLATDRILVLLDMNGTCLFRSRTLLASRQPPAFKHNVGRDSTTYLLHYYMRPNAGDLLTFLLTHPKVVFAFYTSMKYESALPAVNFLLETARLKGAFVDHDPRTIIYAREFQQPDPNAANHWDTIRYLPAVWNAQGMVGHGFDVTNTIVIDDTYKKMQHLPDNVIVVNEYTAEGVLSEQDDNELSGLIGLVGALLESPETDVRRALAALREPTEPAPLCSQEPCFDI